MCLAMLKKKPVHRQTQISLPDTTQPLSFLLGVSKYSSPLSPPTSSTTKVVGVSKALSVCFKML